LETRKARFLERIASYPEAERERLLNALAWGESLHIDQLRASGEPYYIHPIETSLILIDLGLDSDAIIAGLLHDALEDTSAKPEEIEARFGKAVADMVRGVTKIDLLQAKSKSAQAAETIRKMLFAMTKDIRVILIKLADKLNNMRTLQHLSLERQRAFASECLEIYAPLADRLGISWLKDELEDLSLKALNREVYDQIKDIVSAKKGERDAYLSRVSETIRAKALESGYFIEVESRAKHFYSIYQKMRKRNKTADELFDLYGIRIICEDENDCYSLLGLVHSVWKPIEGRFKDYIAMPKANGYRSLHTTVMCFEGRLLEIQIRTKEMHRVAENGVASHWLYKRGTQEAKDLSILSRLKDWEGFGSADILEEIKRDLLKDSIVVFTPKGEALELPAGSTPIDFAYHIHTDIGEHCIGAKADGVIVPLTAELKNTQVIEILTAQNARPHINWLRYARTSKARGKIKHWLSEHDESLLISKNIVAKKRAAEQRGAEQRAAEQRAVEARERERQQDASTEQRVLEGPRAGVRSGDMRNMVIRFARCCSPATGDPIVGYVSRGRGIIVHRKDCQSIAFVGDFAERALDVEWETSGPKQTKLYKLRSEKSQGLFSEIEGAIRKQQGHILEGKLEEEGPGTYLGSFLIEIEEGGDFGKITHSLRSVPGITSVTYAE
jgi:GTP pyrophosphokinase